MKLYRYLMLALTLALAALAAPAFAAPAPAGKLATYTHPDGLWSVEYPSDLLHVEKLSGDVTIFISKDRHTVAAVDSYAARGDAYGNTGEDLRNRARDTLRKIYGKPVQNTLPLQAPGAPWATGITFTTAKGSQGAAVYEQSGRAEGDYQVRGFLYGYKARSERAMLPILTAMRDSFKIGPFAPQGIDYARDALRAYFGALYAGRYADAAMLYGGTYDILAGWNPDVAPRDQPLLLERGCEQNGLQCLQLRRIVEERMVSSAEFRFVVEFLNDDGTIFRLGPCCGETTGKIVSRFTYTVRNVGGEYLVQELPVYVP